MRGGAVVIVGERGEAFARTTQRMESRRSVCCDGASGRAEGLMRVIFGFSVKYEVGFCAFWLAGGDWRVFADLLSELCRDVKALPPLAVLPLDAAPFTG